MFTWVCPNCGKELDLSIKECPDCRERAATAVPEQPAAAEEPPSEGARFWLMLGLAAVVGIVVIVAIVHYRSRPATPAAAPSAPKVSLDRPSAPAAGPSVEPAATIDAATGTPVAGAAPVPAPAVPSADSIEVAGIRMSYDSQNRPQVRALVINHGEEGFRGALTVTLRPVSSASDAPPLGRFTVRLGAEIKPGESREVRAPLDALATLAAMPPWRKLRADVSLQ